MLLIISLESSFLTPVKEASFTNKTINQIYLNKIKVKKGNKIRFEEKKQELFLTDNYYNIYKNLKRDEEKKIFIKLSLLNLSKDNPYFFLIKDTDNTFYMESAIVVEKDYGKIKKVVKDFKSYENWLLENINVRRNKEDRKFFLTIEKFRYFHTPKMFLVDVDLRAFFNDSYKLRLNLEENLDLVYFPYFKVKIHKSTNITKDLAGVFYFIDIGGNTIIYFIGFAKVYWGIYNFIPIGVARTEIKERVETLIENVEKRTNTIE